MLEYIEQLITMNVPALPAGIIIAVIRYIEIYFRFRPKKNKENNG